MIIKIRQCKKEKQGISFKTHKECTKRKTFELSILYKKIKEIRLKKFRIIPHDSLKIWGWLYQNSVSIIKSIENEK